ncbi:MAG: hypothetical protein U9Q90_01190 [Campylobacterota bacterium]|nr:hypothetical protein [Campylobacterota bacterium]
MTPVDISHIAAENHDYAIHLATYQKVLTYKNGSFNIDTVFERDPYEAVDFWRNISLAAEVLLKASLLKHQIPFFKKRAHGEYGEKVTASDNEWLKGTLQTLQIDYVAQINTGTISTAIKSAEATLFEKISFNPEKAELISEMFYIIIRTRRNRNNHFFFPNQGIIEMPEVEILFLPLLNLLEEVYET